MSKILIILTSAYPNANGEVFVENEIHIISKYFDKVIIVCTDKKKEGINRKIPVNADVLYYQDNLSTLEKIFSLSHVFSKIFLEDKNFYSGILNQKFNWQHFKILITDIEKSRKLKKFLQKTIRSLGTNNKITLYSYWSDYKAAAIARISRGRQEILRIARNHRWDIYFYANKDNYLPLRPFIFKNLDAVFCISEDGLNYVQESLKIPTDNVYVSKLGTFSTTKSFPTKSSNLYRIVSCSNVIPVKRVELILQSLTHIEDMQIHWIHFGSGPMLNELIQKSNALKISDRVKIEFAGHTPNQKILEFYEKNFVDLFINVSQSEGVPVSIMEAMSYGIPCIATRIGGIAEIVQHNYNGYLLQENPSSESLAQAILLYFQNSTEQQDTFRQNARKTWEENFNAEKNYKDFAEKISTL